MAGWGCLVVLASFLVLSLAASVNTRIGANVTKHKDILMRGAKPLQPDAYLCTGYDVDEDEAYVVKFEALADADTAHHILMYGCEDGPYSRKDRWGCPPICRGGPQQIMFAWAKNAPPTQLPDGVGFRIGKRTSIRTIVLQIHYAKSFKADEDPDNSGIRLHITHEPQPNVAGIFLMMSYSFVVPPNNPKYHVDMSCQYNKGHSMFPFAYRTHAHGLGSVITGYQYNNTGYHMIGKGNPQWPQAFYPANNSIEVKPGDKLVARCTYNSKGSDHYVHVGATGNDEMCNFYIMFYTNASVRDPAGQCGGVSIQNLVDNMPADSDVTLPPNPLLDEAAHGHHHHHSMVHSSSSSEQQQLSTSTRDSADKNADSDFPAKEVWLDLQRADASPHNLAFQQYLARLGGRGTFADQVQPNLEDSPSSEERLPTYFEQWLEGLGDDIDLEKRMGGEYYEDYAANDEREKGTFPEVNPSLSRNRNKAFEAMNQEMKGFQHIKPPGKAKNPGPWQYPQTNSRKKIGSQLGAPNPSQMGNRPPLEPLQGKLEFKSNWPSQQTRIGQVGGVATDGDGNVYIFHRGPRVWDHTSFDLDNNFQYQNSPIMNDTVMVFSRDGTLIRQFGSGKFFMPHGIAVDDKGNIWLTDVALHQVFRIPPNGTEPDLTLGEPFVHHDDAAHFCKPSDVAILSSGEFFVTDGYCNSRVMKFSKGGNFLKQWGRGNPFAGGEPDRGEFEVPHSVTVAEDMNLVCVADRENGRIQCFDLEGNFKYIIKHPEFGTRLFAVEYCPRHGGLLFAVNGPSYDVSGSSQVRGFTISLNDRDHRLLESWTLPTREGLQNPHDVAVDVEGHAVYVGELNPPAVWKFQRQSLSPSTASPTIAAPTGKPAAVQQPVTQIADKKSNIEPGAEDHVIKETADKDNSRKDALTHELIKDAEKEEEEESDFTPSIIIGVLLVIPVILLLVITLFMRMHHRGWNSCFSSMQTPKVFSLQNFLGNSHKGFDKLSQDDSDHDADVLSDSDNEEFRQPIKSKA